MHKELIVLVILCIASFFLFTHKLTDVPPGINGDEAAIGLNAASISITGHDFEQRFLPLFSNTKNSPDWKQPITLYTSAFIFKIFGISYFNLRLTSVFLTILSSFIIYLLIKEVINSKVAFFGVILFLTTPIVMIQSHLAIENIAPVPFVSLWLLLLIKYTKLPSRKLLLFTGILLGISIFSYLGMRMIAPVLGMLTMLYVYYLHIKNKKLLRNLKWFLIGSLPFALVLLISKFYYPGSILGQFRPYRIADYQSMILPYLSSFDLSFLFLKGDTTPYHSTGKQGMFLLASLPLFLIGIIHIIRKPLPVLTLALVSFFTIPLLFGIGSTIYRASRLLSLIPFYILIASLGIQTMFTIKYKLLRFNILVLTLILISLNYTDFLMDYWYQYPQRVKAEFAKPVHQVYEKLAIVANNQGLTPYVDYYVFKPYPDAESFFRLIYFPQGLSEWSREKQIPSKSIILTDIHDIPFKEKFDIIKIEGLDYYFLINKYDTEI